MAVPAWNVVSMCAGGGGLDLALRLAVPAARTVLFVERETCAAAALAKEMGEGRLDEAPIWSDLESFRPLPWRGLVDCVIAGFPCQDISPAGKGAGITGTRSGVWFTIAEHIRVLRPRWVFLENSDFLINRGLHAVLGSLAEFGYDAEWSVLSAAAVGGPHRRRRCFILAGLAEPEGVGREAWDGQPGSGQEGEVSGGVGFAEHGCGAVGDSVCKRQPGGHKGAGWAAGSEPAGPCDDAPKVGDPSIPRREGSQGVRRCVQCEGQTSERAGGAEVADPTCSGEESKKQCRYGSGAVCGRDRATVAHPECLPIRIEQGRVESSPTDGQELGGVSAVAGHDRARVAWPPGRDADPDGPEWAVYLEHEPGTEPALPRGADGMADRIDRLRISGNGVVPVVGAVAFLSLLARFHTSHP